MSTLNRKIADLIRPSGDIKLEHLDEIIVGQDSSDVTNTVRTNLKTSVYDSLGELPVTNLVQGDRALIQNDSNNGRFYLSNGSGWYNIAMVNTNPSVSFDSDRYDLDSNNNSIQFTLNESDFDQVNLTPTYSFYPPNWTDSSLSFTQTDSGGIISTSGLGGGYTGSYSGKIFVTLSDGLAIATDSADVTLILQTFGDGAGGGLGADTSNVNEGSSVTFTAATAGYADGQTFPYTITGISAADITEGLTGNMTVASNVASVTINVIADATTEGAETMAFTCQDQTVNVTVNDTSTDPTYTLSRNYSSRNEGQTVTFTMTTTNVSDGTTIAYSVSGISSADLSSGSLTGNFTINSNTGSASFTFASDATTEGDETMTLTSQGQSLTCTVVDTSQDPVYSVGALITGTDQASSVSSTGTQIWNQTYSSIGSSGVNTTSGSAQVGDWIYYSVPFYSITGYGNVYSVTGGNTYITPFQFYNGWNNYGYATNISGGQAWGTISRSLTGISSSERTGRVVWKYSQGSSSGTAEQGVLQMVNIQITTLGSINIASSSDLSGWQCTTGHGYNFSDYNDIGVSDWSSMQYNSSGSGRWQCSSSGPQGANLYAASNGTGIRGNPGPGAEFYTHVQYQSTSQVGYYWMQTPEFTVGSSSLSVSAQFARRGANMGSLQIYWVPS